MMSNWYALGLSTTRNYGRREGPFASAAEAKRWLAAEEGERGPWKTSRRFPPNSNEAASTYVGDGWEVVPAQFVRAENPRATTRPREAYVAPERLARFPAHCHSLIRQLAAAQDAVNAGSRSKAARAKAWAEMHRLEAEVNACIGTKANPRRPAKRRPAKRGAAGARAARGPLGARKRNPLPIPGGFEDPELYTMGYGLPDHLKGSVPNVDPEGTDVSAWVWDTPRGSYLLAFRGRSKKPVEYVRYRSGDARDVAVADLIRGAKASLRMKEDREAAKRAYRHDFKVGDVFYTSWGYDQTNVDFYQVLAVSEKSVKVAAVGSKSAGHGYVLPTSRVVGPTKTVVPRGGGFKIEGHYAGKWSGKPVYATPSGWGH